MSIRKRNRAPARNAPEEFGNQRLGLLVLVLTAVFLALGIFTMVYRSRPSTANRELRNSAASLVTTDETRPETTIGVRSFTGVIRELNPDRLTVRMTEIRNGKRFDRLVLVTLTNATAVASLSDVKTEVTASGEPVAVRQKLPADRSLLKVNTIVEIHATDIVDDKTSVVAEAIDILSP